MIVICLLFEILNLLTLSEGKFVIPKMAARLKIIVLNNNIVFMLLLDFQTEWYS